MIRLLLFILIASCAERAQDFAAVEQPISYAEWLIAPGGAADGVNYGLIVDNNTSDGTLNYGIQVRNSSTASGQHFGLHVNTNGISGGTNYGILVGADGGAQNVALKTNHGDVVLNAESGVMRSNGNTTLGSTNSNLRTGWGHESVRGNPPTLNCGTGAVVTGADTRGFVTAGGDAASCVLTFSRTFYRSVSCIVTARDAVAPTYQVSNTALVIAVAPSATYDYDCECVGGASCQ